MRADRHSPNRGTSPTRSPGFSPFTSPFAEMNASSGMRFELAGPSGQRTIVFGGPSVLGRRDSDDPDIPAAIRGSPPQLSEYLRNQNISEEDAQRRSIPGALMAQYIMTWLGGGRQGMRGTSPFFGPFGTMGGDDGPDRLGDYVFSQDALDQILTQLMEGANSTRPVAATEDIIDNLPRAVLEEGSPLLGENCAVCKELFSLTSENPEDQVVVTLSCNHAFHEGCIVPWLKSSGTCPVCRFALIPQPTAHPTGPGPPGSSSSGSGSGSGPSSPGPGPGNAGAGNSGASSSNFFSSFFREQSRPNRTVSTGRRSSHGMRPSNASTRPSPRPSNTPRTSHRPRDRESESDHFRIPGAWDDVD